MLYPSDESSAVNNICDVTRVGSRVVLGYITNKYLHLWALGMQITVVRP